MSEETSNDRVGLCVFTFTEGRQCSMPKTNNGLNLCYFHEQKEHQRRRALHTGVRVAEFLNSDLQTSCDLNASLAMLFRAREPWVRSPRKVPMPSPGSAISW